MNHETDPRRGSTIEQIASAARETLLRTGRHIPTLIAEGSSKTAVVEFENFGKSSQDNQEQLMEIGFRLAQNSQFGLLKQAFFISEAWMSVSTLDKPPTLPPAQDPNRREILSVSGLAVENYHVSILLYAMIRDPEGRLTEVKALEQFPDSVTSKENPLLDALFFGFAMGLFQNPN
ncbi:MAG: hypothetical protein ACYDBJ_26630 [Aggregatilineales bacterium]